MIRSLTLLDTFNIASNKAGVGTGFGPVGVGVAAVLAAVSIEGPLQGSTHGENTELHVASQSRSGGWWGKAGKSLKIWLRLVRRENASGRCLSGVFLLWIVCPVTRHLQVANYACERKPG